MGLFDRLRNRDSSDHGLAGIALVKGSRALANTEQEGVSRNSEVSSNSLNALNIGKIQHDLTLDIRVPGRAPYEVTQRIGVPAKATGRQGYQLPVGVELPIIVDGDKPDDFKIDWKSFLDAPDRKANVQRAAARESEANATAYTNLVPGMKEQTWANAAAGLPMWMQAVRDGKMSRKAFNQQVDVLTKIGQMDPELCAFGKQTLDAEGLI